MKKVTIFRVDKWTRQRVNKHTKGMTQTINNHHVNIVIFGFVWRKVFEWDEYIDCFYEP